MQEITYNDFWSELKQTNTLNTAYERYRRLIDQGLDKNKALKILKRTSEPEMGTILFEKLMNFCREKNMTQIWHYLSLYCSVDCLGVLVAMEKMKESFRKLANLDMFEFNTLPSLSYSWALKHLAEYPEEPLNYVVKLGSIAFNMINSNIRGGASTILKRLAVCGYTKIQPHMFEHPETVENILLLDFNTLYGSTAKFECPVLGSYSIRLKSNNFRIETVQERGLMQLCWLRYESILVHKKSVQTILSLRSEKRLHISDSRTARLDGWMVVDRTKKGEQIGYSFEFHGSVVHSHPDIMSKEEFEHGVNPISGRPNKEVYEETLTRDEEIRKHPRVAKHIVMWEHEWKKKLKENPFLRGFVQQSMLFLAPKPVQKSFSWERCLELILEKKLHGVVKCSLRTPPQKMKSAVLYPPFWLHRDLTRTDLCDTEKDYAKKYDMLKGKKVKKRFAMNYPLRIL